MLVLGCKFVILFLNAYELCCVINYCCDFFFILFISAVLIAGGGSVGAVEALVRLKV